MNLFIRHFDLKDFIFRFYCHSQKANDKLTLSMRTCAGNVFSWFKWFDYNKNGYYVKKLVCSLCIYYKIMLWYCSFKKLCIVGLVLIQWTKDLNGTFTDFTPLGTASSCFKTNVSSVGVKFFNLPKFYIPYFIFLFSAFAKCFNLHMSMAVHGCELKWILPRAQVIRVFHANQPQCV